MINDVTVTKEDMNEALLALGFEKDSILLTHSSLKSLGKIEGGAPGVIEALWRAVPNGTLVFPTLSQKNWSTVFEDWHMDRPSDVGLISETFRTQEGSLRSNNATHSVAARGVHASDIVSGPHDKGARFGIFGFYSFSHYSPWQKMYDSREKYGVRAYVLFWGVSMMYNTFKHFCEYRFIEKILSDIRNDEEREALKSELGVYGNAKGTTEETIMWPFYNSEKFSEVLLAEGIAKKVDLGEGSLIACDIFDMVNRTERALAEDTENMLHPRIYEWVKRARAAGGN